MDNSVAMGIAGTLILLFASHCVLLFRCELFARHNNERFDQLFRQQIDELDLHFCMMFYMDGQRLHFCVVFSRKVLSTL